MASSAVAALMLERESQRIEAQGTHEIFLAKLLELSEAKIDIMRVEYSSRRLRGAGLHRRQSDNECRSSLSLYG